MTIGKNEPAKRVTCCKDCDNSRRIPEMMCTEWMARERINYHCILLGLDIEEDFYCKYATPRSEEV